jgi:hypothetical protein
MFRAFLGVGLLAVLGFERAEAIEDVATSSYRETAPAAADIANWDSGWTQPSTEPAGYTYTTGWNYVGTVNGAGSFASGVYLGNGWVLTAAHVGAGTFNLAGTNYPMVPNSAQSIGTSDLTLFQVYPCPVLPALPLSSSDPKVYSSQVAAMGYGDGGANTNETWGYNTVTQINQSVTPQGMSFVSNDFWTLTGTSSSGGKSATNNYQIVSGDSGGGDFIYNSSEGRWELAGINEVTGTVTYSDGSTQNFSGFVQLDTYASQIDQIITPPASTPALPPWALVLLGGMLVFVATSRMEQKE